MKSLSNQVCVAILAVGLFAAIFVVVVDAADFVGAVPVAETPTTVVEVEQTSPVQERELAVTTDAEAEDAEAELEFAGEVLEVTGPETEPASWNAIQAALNVFGERTGAVVTYTGLVDWESEMSARLAVEMAPNVSIFGDPVLLAEFAESQTIRPLFNGMAATFEAEWGEQFLNLGAVDGQPYAVPVDAELESIIWFDTNVFGAGGYSEPATVSELQALTQVMISDGIVPWCVGTAAESAPVSIFGDWTKSFVLANHGSEVYDQWVRNEVPFSDARVVGSMQQVLDLWRVPGAVNGGFAAIATTPALPAQDLLSRQCAMVHGPSGFATELPEDIGHIGWFPFPAADEEATAIVDGGLAAAFDASPPTQALLSFMGSSEFANARQVAQRESVGGGISGLTTGNSGVDGELWSDSGVGFNAFLAGADVVRFDAFESTPSRVRDAFFVQETALLDLRITPFDAAAQVDAVWPLR